MLGNNFQSRNHIIWSFQLFGNKPKKFTRPFLTERHMWARHKTRRRDDQNQIIKQRSISVQTFYPHAGPVVSRSQTLTESGYARLQQALHLSLAVSARALHSHNFKHLKTNAPYQISHAGAYYHHLWKCSHDDRSLAHTHA